MRSLAFAIITLAVTAALLPAQGRGPRPGDIPPGHRPPPGLCRIWIDGVPPGRQPAPTRCEDAVRHRPSNARVIYGSDSRSNGRWDTNGRRDRDDDRWDDRDDDRDDDRWDERDRKSKGKYKGKSKRTRRDDRQAHDVCYDRDHDGWCDWREGSRTAHERRSSDRCLDRNHDGRCDDAVARRVSKGGLLTVILGRY